MMKMSRLIMVSGPQVGLLRVMQQLLSSAHSASDLPDLMCGRALATLTFD